MKKLLFFAGILTLMASCQCNTEKLSPVLSIEGGQVQGVTVDRVKDVFVFQARMDSLLNQFPFSQIDKAIKSLTSK